MILKLSDTSDAYVGSFVPIQVISCPAGYGKGARGCVTCVQNTYKIDDSFDVCIDCPFPGATCTSQDGRFYFWRFFFIIT